MQTHTHKHTLQTPQSSEAVLDAWVARQKNPHLLSKALLGCQFAVTSESISTVLEVSPSKGPVPVSN